MQVNGEFMEEWFNAVMNGMEEGIIITNEKFEIQSINSEAEKITGWKREEILKKGIQAALTLKTESGQDFAEYFFSNSRQYETPLPCNLISKNSEQVFIEIRLEVIKASRDLKGYIIFFKKNNEGKRWARQIRENERKYKGLFENALEGIFILDDESNIVDANPAACSIYHLKKEYLLKLKVKDIFPHKSAEESAMIWKEFLDKKHLDGFYKYKLNSNEDRYIDFRVRANFIQGFHLAVFSDVTEKTQTGKALRNSEANLKAIFNNANQQFVLLDNEFRIVTLNEGAKKKAVEILGKEMHVGLNIFEYASKDGRERIMPFFERVKRGETIFMELNPSHVLKPDHWVEVGLIPVFDAKRVLKGFLLSFTDITFRKKAELNLAESEARFRSLVQNSSDIITILAESYQIKYTSASIENILGYKEEYLVGKNILEYIHEDERAAVKSTLSKIIKGEHFNSVLEYRFLHVDGYYLHLETTCNNLVSNEHIQGIVLNTRDITERKYQEENLLLLERAIDSGSNGIVISDPNQPDNPIIYANKAFEQITGYSYLDIIGKNCRYLQGNDRDQEEIKKLKKSIADQKEVSVVLRNYRKDGRFFWNELSISPVFNRNGELSNYIGVINDITERKIAEDSILEISQGISASDLDVYGALVKHIGLRLQMDFCFVGEFVGNKIRTRGFWQDGTIKENVEYELKGTPCITILEKGVCFTYDHVSQRFPEDLILSEEKVDAYMGVPLKDSHGKTIGILVVMSRKPFQNLPLTESILNIFSVRGSAELERDYYIAALKASEQKFKDLATNSPDLIYIIDLDLKKIIYFNKTDILGYSNKELSISEGWLQIVHPDDISRVKDHWIDFLAYTDNITKAIEYRIRTKEGIYEWVTNRHIVLERGLEGNPKLILLNLTVVTERKKAEEGLRESEARLMALIENTNDVMWSVDTSLSFTTMNSAFKNLFKLYFNKDISVGDNLQEALPESLQKDWIIFHERTLKGERFSVEFIITGQSQDLSYEVSYNPIYSDKGQLSGVSVFARDITQRKLAENDIIRTNFELDSFVYRASHDLRAPLRSVLGLINLTKTETDEKERNTYLHLVEKSVNKLDTFISDLTNFSRNSRLDVTISKIDFQGIIDGCLENLKYMDNAERINTIIKSSSDIDFYSDSTRINIILQNIISNAIKYQNLRIDEPYVLVDIQAENDYVEITISDNGKGIKEEYLDKIFNMFFRASQESYGSGLGLYITKQVVEKLNGTIKVSSKLGLGTEFKVKLPNIKN